MKHRSPLRFPWRMLLAIYALAFAIPLAVNAQITVTTDWSSSGNPANAQHYGINVWSGMDPNTAQNSTYKARLSDINPGLIRLHAGEQLINGNAKSWLASNGTSWDTARVQTVINNITMGGDRMVTITGWPSVWDDGTGRLQTSHYSDYSNFCASLVQIVKNTGKYVKYWEPFNEKNDAYNGNGAELGRIFVQCRTAMRNVDSTIQVGGPAWTQPWDNTNFDACLTQIGANIDFVSYHQYGTYQSTTDYQSLYNSTGDFGGGSNNVRNKLNYYGQSGKPLFLGEYNMFSDWTLDSAGLMRSDKSSVYDALVLRSLLQTGKADWAASWNDADNTFGKLDGGFNMRPSAYLLRLARQKLVGTLVSSTSSNDGSVVSLAVKNGSARCLLVICRSDSSQTVNLAFANNWFPANSTYNVHTVSGSGYSVTSTGWGGAPVYTTLGANSVSLFEFTGDGTAGSSGPVTSGTVYRITPKNSGKALDVSGMSTDNGAQVQQWTYYGSSNQQWKVEDAGGGWYKITAQNSGKCLDVSGFSKDDGGNVQQWTYLGGDNQLWKIEDMGGGWCRVTSKNSGKVLDVSGSGTADGTRVQQWTDNGSDAQRWKFQ